MSAMTGALATYRFCVEGTYPPEIAVTSESYGVCPGYGRSKFEAVRSTSTRLMSRSPAAEPRLSASYVELSSCCVVQYVPFPSVRIFVQSCARFSRSAPCHHVSPAAVSQMTTAGGRLAGAMFQCARYAIAVALSVSVTPRESAYALRTSGGSSSKSSVP